MGQVFSHASYMSSHGDLTPVRTLYTTMIVYIMVPTGAVAYYLSGGSILTTMTAAMTIPFIGILQGTYGIISYRLYYGDAPIPITPSHGVVICHEPSKPATGNNNATESTNTLNHSKSSPNLENHLPLPMNQRTKSFPSTQSKQNGNFFPGNRRISYGQTEELSNDTRRPIRLLVIGDSIAIGVGQARQCTPIMPEVLAKTLSARLGGRVVYWTCHGAPGASTGWIVRELERGVQKMDDNYNESDFDDYYDDEDDDSEDDMIVDKINTNVVQLQNVSIDVSDESSLSGDESTTLALPPEQDQQVKSRFLSANKIILNNVATPSADPVTTGMTSENVNNMMENQQRTIWRERLAQHRKYFDPDDLVHYDIVVVMTGGNDLKSALFPFLLTGEDAEFRRQAKARGGNYTKELMQLLQTINRDVRTRLRHIRYSVEAAAETVIETVEQNMELIVKSTCSPTARRMSSGSALNFHEKVNARKEQDLMLSEQLTNKNSSSKSDSLNHEQLCNKPYPLVVLPGLPSRTLPIFSAAPLNWGAIPIVDILDMHKRRLANSHPGEVMFIPPPSVNQMVQYESCQGDIWHQRCKENTVLALRDVRRHDCHRVTKELRKYYNERDPRQLSGEGLKKTSNHSWWLSKFITPKGYCDGIFAVDRVHPNDDGYDFYGRYIANSIADEWLAHPTMIPSER